MKKVYFILSSFLLIFFFSFKTDKEFKLTNSFPIVWGDNCITENDCFYLSADSNYYLISYSDNNGNKQVIDSILRGEAESIILNDFQSENSHVVLLKIEYESFPSFNAYYINDGKLMKIGEWLVYTPCQSCDTFDYPIKGIRIFQRNEEIEFTFLQDAYYSEGYECDWTLHKAGNLTLSFNIADGQFRKTTK